MKKQLFFSDKKKVDFVQFSKKFKKLVQKVPKEKEKGELISIDPKNLWINF